MFFSVNELSFTKAKDNNSAVHSLNQFAELVGKFIRSGFSSGKLWSRDNFLSFEISENFRVVDWLKRTDFSSDQDKIKNQILKRFLIDKNSLFDWNEEERRKISSYPIIAVDVGGSQNICSEGLKIACVYETICLSLPGDSWTEIFIDAIWLDDQIEQSIQIHHASRPEHHEQHQDWIVLLFKKRKLLVNWSPSKNIFPNLQSSNEIAPNGDWEDFHRQRLHSTKSESLSLIKHYGHKVAIINFYQLDKRLSQLNSSTAAKRIIYKAGNGRDRIYLSLDLEHGGFEVCDFKGRHIGEYFFDGKKKSDAKEDHSIIL